MHLNFKSILPRNSAYYRSLIRSHFLFTSEIVYNDYEQACSTKTNIFLIWDASSSTDFSNFNLN